MLVHDLCFVRYFFFGQNLPIQPNQIVIGLRNLTLSTSKAVELT